LYRYRKRAGRCLDGRATTDAMSRGRLPQRSMLHSRGDRMQTHMTGSPYNLSLHDLRVKSLQHSSGLRKQPDLPLLRPRSASFPAACKTCRHSQLEAHLLSRVQADADQRMSEAKILIDELKHARQKLCQVWQERPSTCRLEISAGRNKQGWNALRGLLRGGKLTNSATASKVCLQPALASLNVDLTSLQAAEDKGRDAAEVHATKSKPLHFKCGICLANCWLAEECSVHASCCGQAYCGLCWLALAKNAVSQSNVQDCLCPTPECRAKHQAALTKVRSSQNSYRITMSPANPNSVGRFRHMFHGDLGGDRRVLLH